MKATDRRTFLRTTAVGGAIIAAGPTLLACGGEEEWELAEQVQYAGETPHDKKLFSKYFKVEVKGVYGEVPGVTEVDAGRVTVAVEETTQDDKPEYRTYTYGSHEYDDFTMTLQTGPGMVKLQSWADKAMKMGGSGDALRRDISVYAMARDKTTILKTINCFGCYPISMNAGDHSTGSDVKSITLTCNVDRIEVA
jgi:hypothetical protein